MFIERKSALKVFYYLMSIDGVNGFEREKFHEIGKELVGEEFTSIKDLIVEECQKRIDAISIHEERYDVIQEGLDAALAVTVNKRADGITPKLLVWDMLSIANCDNDYSESENRLITHVARILQIEKSVFAEMKQLIETAVSLQNEQELLEQSDRPYSEIRPLVEEIEKRKQVIIEAAKELLEDEILLDESETEKKENVVLNAGKKIGESFLSGGKKIGESFLSGGKKLGGSVPPIAQGLGGKAVKGATGLKSGAGKIFSKIKDTTKKKE